jgi:hypothetical protein
MSFVPSHWLKERDERHDTEGKYLSYLREALGFPTGTLDLLQEFALEWRELSRADQIELIEEAKLEYYWQ